MQRRLAADLASDRTAPSGDKDDLSADIASDLFHMQVDGLPPEKVLYADVLQHGDVDLLVHHLVDSRKHLDLACGLLADLQQRFPLPLLQSGNRYDDFFNMVMLRHLRDRLFPAYDRDSLEIGSDFVRIIVNNARNLPVQMLAVLHLTDEHIAGRARSYYHRHHRFRLSGVLAVVIGDPQKAVRKPGDNDAYREKHDIDKNITSRHRVPQQLHSAELYEGRQHDRRDRVLEFLNAGEAPQACIKLADRIDQHSAYYIDPHIAAD